MASSTLIDVILLLPNVVSNTLKDVRKNMTNTESSLNTPTYQTHEMKLHPTPFDLIKSGRKTVEMRLNDEKRRLVRIKDHIRFVNMSTGEELLARVLGREVYPSFCELYKDYDKISIG